MNKLQRLLDANLSCLQLRQCQQHVQGQPRQGAAKSSDGWRISTMKKKSTKEKMKKTKKEQEKKMDDDGVVRRRRRRRRRCVATERRRPAWC